MMQKTSQKFVKLLLIELSEKYVEEPAQVSLKSNEHINEVKSTEFVRAETFNKFVPHPISMGVDYQKFNAALKYRRDSRRIQKHKEKLGASGRFLHNTPFFPNFIDPVAPQATIPIIQPVEQLQSYEVSQSNIPASTNDSDNDDNSETIVLTAFQGITFMKAFGGLCPNVIYNDGCSDTDCFHLTHELPSNEKFEAKLQSYPKSNVQTLFELVQTFPSQVQLRFFPAFAIDYARRRQWNEMKKLLKSCQQSTNSYNCSDYIVEAMKNNGWSHHEAVKFLVDDHEHTNQLT